MKNAWCGLDTDEHLCLPICHRVSLVTKELGVLPYPRLYSAEFKSSHTKVKQEFQAPTQPKGLFN